MVLLSIGTAVLPSCDGKEENLVKFKSFTLNNSEVTMLAQLSDTIIPKTNFIGASDVKAHEFALMMVDDCYEPEKQKIFIMGMKDFNKQAKNKYGSSFASCTSPQKKEWLIAIEKKTGIPEEVVFFYETTKRHTVQAFTSSKEYMTDVKNYKMVPGSDFKGCVPVRRA